MPSGSARPSPAFPHAHLWTLPGGLRVAFERRATPGFAFDLRVPVGSAHDPLGLEGASGVLEEWLFKGAATPDGRSRDARGLQDAFDDLGVRRGGGVGPEATRLNVSGLGADLSAALHLVADVLMRPELPSAELSTLTDLARQDLERLEDNPVDCLDVEARRAAFPRPVTSPYAGYIHPASGTPAGLEALTPAALRAHLERYGQAGSVLGLVADLDPQAALDAVQSALGELRPGQDDRVPAVFRPASAHVHDAEAEQTHLSLTAPGIAPADPRWLTWQLVLSALSGGSASRLFQAVREERGLAYAISASPVLLGGEGFLNLYAGSTPARAPETLAVMRAELARLALGLTDAEFRRARTGLETGVVFGAESLQGRAGSLTRDVAVFGRVRPLAELRAGLAALTLEGVNAFLAEQAGRPSSLVTLGPAPIAASAMSEAAHA